MPWSFSEIFYRNVVEKKASSQWNISEFGRSVVEITKKKHVFWPILVAPDLGKNRKINRKIQRCPKSTQNWQGSSLEHYKTFSPDFLEGFDKKSFSLRVMAISRFWCSVFTLPYGICLDFQNVITLAILEFRRRLMARFSSSHRVEQ